MLRFKYMTNAIGYSANTLTANRSGVREGYKNITQTFVIARPGNSSTWILDKPIFSTTRARGNIRVNIMNC